MGAFLGENLTHNMEAFLSKNLTFNMGAFSGENSTYNMGDFCGEGRFMYIFIGPFFIFQWGGGGATAYSCPPPAGAHDRNPYHLPLAILVLLVY